MNEFFKQLKQEALNTKLSHGEKQHMRVSLYDVMKKTPAPTQEVRPHAVRSTYVWFSFISSPRFAVPVALLLVMGLGSGTAFAAQGSLPGDILYPIKINVNETVEVALATTPAAKAKTEESLADRRVTEAQTLADQGRLDASTTQEIEDNFDQHASRALALNAEIPAAATESVVADSATTSATTSEATTSVDVSGAEPQLMHVSFKAASIAPTATSNNKDESDLSISSASSSEIHLSESLQKQKNILNALKQRVSHRSRGSSNNSNNNRGDGSIGNQGSTSGEDDHSNSHGDN